MTDFKYDYYRVYGNTQINPFNIFKHFKLRYLFWWRKITNKSKLSIVGRLVLKHMRKIYHIEIPYTVKLGKGFFMDHAYNITINSKAVIGDNVSMYKGATIGANAKGVPTIGNRVYIGLNATIVGNIKIGDDVLVAPNSYINFDVPSHSVVIGNPGVIHHKENATIQDIFNVVETDE